MQTIRFGIIGCGLMAREFASAAADGVILQKMFPNLKLWEFVPLFLLNSPGFKKTFLILNMWLPIIASC